VSSATPSSRLAFHHLGLLTSRPEAAVRHLEALGYEMGEEVVDPLQEARLRLGSPGSGAGPTLGPAIELITPLPGNVALARLLKRRDDYIYHLCYEVFDLKEALALLAVDEGGGGWVPSLKFPGPSRPFCLAGRKFPFI
jgi:hypothetical protein